MTPFDRFVNNTHRPTAIAPRFRKRSGLIVCVSALSALLLGPLYAAAEPPVNKPAVGKPGQPPSVNKPVQQPTTPVQTGPQFVREPVVRPPGQTSPELTRLRQQLQQTEQTLTQLRDKRESLSELSQQDAQQLQQLMDRKAQLEQRISDLLKQQSDATQSIIGNTK